MESDSDYEEPSEDPFEGQFSDSDDSSDVSKYFKIVLDVEIQLRFPNYCL